MKTNKGFTLIELIELLVVIVILAALGGLIAGGIHSALYEEEEFVEEINFEQIQADELRRANDLKERELLILEAREANVEK